MMVPDYALIGEIIPGAPGVPGWSSFMGDPGMTGMIEMSWGKLWSEGYWWNLMELMDDQPSMPKSLKSSLEICPGFFWVRNGEIAALLQVLCLRLYGSQGVGEENGRSLWDLGILWSCQVGNHLNVVCTERKNSSLGKWRWGDHVYPFVRATFLTAQRWVFGWTSTMQLNHRSVMIRPGSTTITACAPSRVPLKCAASSSARPLRSRVAACTPWVGFRSKHGVMLTIPGTKME